MDTDASTSNSTIAAHIGADRNELSPLSGVNQDSKKLRGIIASFSVLTVIVSVFLAVQLEYGDNQIVPHGSVTSDSQKCSAAGVAVIKKGGNAIDAVVAMSFCLGVVQPHLTGLGSGGFLLAYDQRQRMLTSCIDFRVSADIDSGVNKPSHIGVPGFIAGLAQAHKQLGVLPWASLLIPAIEIARAGFEASDSLMVAKSLVSDNSSVYKWISSWTQSILITNPALADTMQIVANQGPDAFYKGRLISQLEEYFTAGELSNYKVLTDSCLTSHYKDYKLVVPGPGSGGPLLLQALTFLNMTLMEESSILSIASALKSTKEVNWTSSTGSHVAAVDQHDLYVTVVSGLGSVFGSQELTQGGYVLNNALDYSSVGSDNRPTSLATPVIAVEDKQICGHRNVLGGSDARDVLQVLIPLLDPRYANVSVSTIVEHPRARITADEVYLEDSHPPHLDPNEKLALTNAQYKVGTASLPYPSINVIHKYGDTSTSVSDSRGRGEAIVF